MVKAIKQVFSTVFEQDRVVSSAQKNFRASDSETILECCKTVLITLNDCFLVIWLLLFKQSRVQFKPIKRRLFCLTGGQEQ